MDVKTKLDSDNYTWTSAAQSIYAMLQYTDKKTLTLSEVMGYSTHAFRINIHPETVSPAGPTMFDPLDLVPKGLKTLGVVTLIESLQTPVSDKKLVDMIRFTQRSLDTGIPVISWDLFAPEFGLIYGYDNEKQVFYAKDIEKDRLIKFSELNQRRFQHLFLCGYLQSTPKTIPIMLKDTLIRTLEYALGKSPFAASREYKHGLEGYEAWIKAFEGRKIDEAGNAYNAAVVADARKHAHRFFSDLLKRWEVSTDLDCQVANCLKEGERIYRKIAEILADIPRMFPFPQGGEPNNISTSKRAIDILQSAHDWEKAGVALLTKLLKLIEKYEDESFMAPFKVHRHFQFVGEEYNGSVNRFEIEVPKNMRSFLKRDYAIGPKITNLRLVAYNSKKEEKQEKATYIVARPVYYEPDSLPEGMVYSNADRDYAYIRTKTVMIKSAYEKIYQWINENGYETNKDSYTIEVFLPITPPQNDEEVEIYLPLKE
ncbi:GyrI-like domain-containing protein [Radiobacillus deserti]|uniref:GyrI-like domain-containing protein n=1 Tax=Radiobacillus deserti TaxID=2594883 RepID=A0A516KDI7_9BACI|nr:GyrI-like domain-containing protein [Radiobacillus deserti]QDP39473.1 GyrI-like domain-containing protein [Radiobacillus deserti]